MDYDEAEQAGRDRQDETGAPTLAQWARAQAVHAVMAAGPVHGGLEAVTDRAAVLAAWIVSGALPKPPPGVSY